MLIRNQTGVRRMDEVRHVEDDPSPQEVVGRLRLLRELSAR